MKKLIIIFFVCILSMSLAQAQRKLSITNQRTHKSVLLSQNNRVMYLLKNKTTAKKGIIKSLDKKFMVVDSDTVFYDSLQALGRKRNSTFVAVVMGVAGVALIKDAMTPDPDPCPTCQNAGTQDEGGSAGKAIEGITGATLVVLSIRSVVINAPKKMNTEWRLEVVE